MGGIWRTRFRESHPQQHSCVDYSDSAASSIYFRLFLCDGRCTPRYILTPTWRYLIGQSGQLPAPGLMGTADASSLPFKIYVPTRLAINHRGVARRVRSNGAKLRAVGFITGASVPPTKPTYVTDLRSVNRTDRKLWLLHEMVRL